jgi:hypothetical protein
MCGEEREREGGREGGGEGERERLVEIFAKAMYVNDIRSIIPTLTDSLYTRRKLP